MAATALGLLAAGCGGDGDVAADRAQTPDVAASCAFVVEYDGHRYLGNAAPVGPVEGPVLGTATQPGCADVPGEPEPDDLELEVAAIEGVSSQHAIVIRGRDDVVLVREDVDFERLPPELARLLRAPRCETGAQPVRLSGRWLGILGADGDSEVDLEPPYDVRIRVSDSSVADYERADLMVRVPAALGRPLTRGDVESSLLRSGTLSATVSCRDGRFVASAVDAAPPG